MKQIILAFLIFISAFSLSAQSTEAVSDEVIKAIETEDAKTLSSSFNDNIEIVLPNKSGVYSRGQAEMVFKDFFENNRVKEFKVIHQGQGKSDFAFFGIANYISESGNFRFTFLTKKMGEKLYIHQIRIEKQDETDM